MRRPVGFTILALVLGWLTFAALGNAAFFVAAPGEVAALGFQPAVLTVAALTYAVTAGLTTIGLWRVRAWSARAAASWAVAFDFLILAFGLMAARADLLPPIPGVLLGGGVLMFVGMPWLLVLYVRSRLTRLYSPAAPAA